MENTIKRLIALIMIFLMSFSVITCVSSNDFTVSAASAKTISIKKKPTVKASKIKATTVKLSWSKTKGATSYRLYKSTDKKKWTLVAKTKKTSYTVKKLNGNKKYYFRVKAYKTVGGKTTKSPYSKIITVKTKKNETVYAKKNVNIRTKSNTKGKVVTVLKKGKSIKRIGYAKNGWSKVSYNGGTYYVSSSYLTTTKPVTTEPTTTKPSGTWVENGLTYYYDENGVKTPYLPETVTGEVTRAQYCDKCGKKESECARGINDYYCRACKKTIKAGECHSESHFDKYY